MPRTTYVMCSVRKMKDEGRLPLPKLIRLLLYYSIDTLEQIKWARSTLIRGKTSIKTRTYMHTKYHISRHEIISTPPPVIYRYEIMTRQEALFVQYVLRSMCPLSRLSNSRRRLVCLARSLVPLVGMEYIYISHTGYDKLLNRSSVSRLS